MKKDNTARSDDDQRSKFQSVQTERSNHFSNSSNQNFYGQREIQNFNLARNFNRNFRADGDGRKFQGHYQQSYVQPRQQYYGNENKRGDNGIRINRIESRRMDSEKVKETLDVMMLDISREEVVPIGSIVRTWKIYIMEVMSGS
jgi:hypothetical protein